MPKIKQKNFEAKLVDHLIEEYFKGDVSRFSEQVCYSKQQIQSWQSGHRKPQKATLRWLLSSTIAPEFRVACEFSPLNIIVQADISKELKKSLKDHAESSGVYAFYDSMCSVIYIGKASSSFRSEMYQQLRAPLGIKFQKAVVKAPVARWQTVKYISAYEVPHVEHLDYPKHVEALALRLSKPIGNKVLGKLQTSLPPKEI